MRHAVLPDAFLIFYTYATSIPHSKENNIVKAYFFINTIK